MLKKIFISLGVVILVAGLVVGGLWLYKSIQPETTVPPDTDTPNNAIQPDTSKNYQACELHSEDDIKIALGEAASDLQAPANDGVVKGKEIGEELSGLTFDTQVCIYAFSPNQVFAKGSGSNNGLVVEVSRFTNEGGPAAFIESIRASGVVSEVKSIGENAFYSANTTTQGPGATYEFKLQVFEENSLTAYTIRQPADSSTVFTEESARLALEALVLQ